MEIEIITKQDLQTFKQDLLREIAAVIRTGNIAPAKEYLRSKEVRDLLKVSNGTLANMRVKGLLKPTKIEGVYYYKYTEIMALLNAGTK